MRSQAEGGGGQSGGVSDEESGAGVRKNGSGRNVGHKCQLTGTGGGGLGLRRQPSWKGTPPLPMHPGAQGSGSGHRTHHES